MFDSQSFDSLTQIVIKLFVIKVKYVDLTCRYHYYAILCLTVSSVIARDEGWLGCIFFFFRRCGNHCLSQHKRDGLNLADVTPMGVGKPPGKTDWGEYVWLF